MTPHVTKVFNLAKASVKLKQHYQIPLYGPNKSLLKLQREDLAKQIKRHPPYRLQEAWATEGNKGICPEFFVMEMYWHWARTLGNVVTDKLEKLWYAEAETFNKLIDAKEGDPWLILSPETGTGKTQGSCLYAALAALYTDTGILFTTRLVVQCEAVVEDIKKMVKSHCDRYPQGGKCKDLSSPIALTVHSKQTAEEKPSADDIYNAPCLVITHEKMSTIYKDVLENEGSFNDAGLARFDEISKWRGGVRVRIVDETPANLVENFQLDESAFDTLHFFFGRRKDKLSSEVQGQLELVDRIDDACREYWDALKEVREGSKVIALGDFLQGDYKPHQFTLQNLFLHVREYPTSSLHYTTEEIAKKKEKAIDCLYALQHIAKSWAVAIANVRGSQIATSAWLVTPPDNIPLCVLDATASTTPFWRVLGAKVQSVDLKKPIRDYRNVTAYLKYLEQGVGKDGFSKDKFKLGKKRVAAVLEFFKQEQRKEKRKVLLCVPKDAKKEIKSCAVESDDVTAKECPKYLAGLKIGHWNALDGRNDFKDCDTVVILSWNYPPQHQAIDLLFAATDQTKRTDDYLKSSKEFRKELDLGHVESSVIQAVNRVRCRKVTADDGSCEPTDIFMLMPKDSSRDAQSMRSTLELEMPNMRFEDWNILSEDEPKKPKVRSGSNTDRLLEFLKTVDPCVTEVKLTEALTELKVSPSGQKDIRKSLNVPEHSLRRQVTDLGWTYRVDRDGQKPLAVLNRVTKG